MTTVFIFISQCQNDPEHWHVQVNIGIRHFKDKMYNYSRQYGLDGVEFCWLIRQQMSNVIALSSMITKQRDVLRSCSDLYFYMLAGEKNR